MLLPMSRQAFSLAYIALFVIVLVNCFSVAEESPAPAYEALWFDSPVCEEGNQLLLALNYPENIIGAEVARFEVEIFTVVPYEMTVVALTIQSLSGASVHEDEITSNLHRGGNKFAFEWDSLSTLPGNYVLEINVDYADNFPSAYCRLPFCKVSSSAWNEQIASYTALLEGLRPLTFCADSSNDLRSQLHLRFNIIEDALKQARQALYEQEWAMADRAVRYAGAALPALKAGLSLGGMAHEQSALHATPSLEAITLESGGFAAAGRPVFLFGIALNSDGENVSGQLDRLKRYGLNFTVDTLPVLSRAEVMAARASCSLNEARRAGIALAIQLNQEDIAGDMMDQWPELMEPDFVNMAHEGFRQTYGANVSEFLKAVAGSPWLACVSIARMPRFKYEGESVRLQFIEQVKERYPDRIDLNRLWKSHLADYDEITIWGDHPEHAYPNRRAYQYEWQCFHREMITNFFAALDQELTRLAPDVPIAATLSDQAFEPDETRYTVNRESMSAMMDINGCAASMGSESDIYAMTYPGVFAYYTLLRSYSSDKPVVNFNGDIAVGTIGDGKLRHAFVCTALWESVMSGLNALVLPSDTNVIACPDALEAFTVTALNINRLGDLVRAFQQAPAPIGILFSEASKIMDNGLPHLTSAQYAFEGASFAGFNVRFLTETQLEEGVLRDIKVLIMPDTPAVSDAAFDAMAKYVDEGGVVARVGTPIPYNEHGHSRNDVIRATSDTVLVRGMNLPTEYLHAMDAAMESGVLMECARPINAFGYPLEGVRSRTIEYEGDVYLYIVNLRKKPVSCYLSGSMTSGRDLVQGRDIDFPRILLPMDPMILKMDKRESIVRAEVR